MTNGSAPKPPIAASSADRPTVIVSKSEPQDHVQRLCAYGLNAVAGEGGTDYVWWPQAQHWGIERKTVSNLLSSLKDRQLVEQTHRGAAQFDRYIILIEGEYRRSASGMVQYYSPRDPRADRVGWVESGLQYAALNGMLFDLQLIGNNVTVHHWPVLFDSPNAIAQIVRQTCSKTHKFIRERQRPDLPALAVLGGKLYADALWALMALPGCGAEVATALLNQYSTLDKTIFALALDGKYAGIYVADVRVNGKRIGEKRATILREAVTMRLS